MERTELRQSFKTAMTCSCGSVDTKSAHILLKPDQSANAIQCNDCLAVWEIPQYGWSDDKHIQAWKQSRLYEQKPELMAAAVAAQKKAEDDAKPKPAPEVEG